MIILHYINKLAFFLLLFSRDDFGLRCSIARQPKRLGEKKKTNCYDNIIVACARSEKRNNPLLSSRKLLSPSLPVVAQLLPSRKLLWPSLPVVAQVRGHRAGALLPIPFTVHVLSF